MWSFQEKVAVWTVLKSFRNRFEHYYANHVEIACGRKDSVLCWSKLWVFETSTFVPATCIFIPATSTFSPSKQLYTFNLTFWTGLIPTNMFEQCLNQVLTSAQQVFEGKVINCVIESWSFNTTPHLFKNDRLRTHNCLFHHRPYIVWPRFFTVQTAILHFQRHLSYCCLCSTHQYSTIFCCNPTRLPWTSP